jgi:putative dimethyl sulfoxide reductase chaperone
MLDPMTRMNEALAKAVVYRAFSIAFQAPTRDRLRDMGALDGFNLFIEALQCIEGQDGTDTLAAAVQPLTAVRIRDLDRLAGEYSRIFGHTTRGLVCACETEFGDGNKFQQPQELADIAGYYLAFGLTPPSASETRLDHVACECEFLEFVNRKQARLLAIDLEGEGDQETLEATAQAERTFLRDHLGRFGRAFGAALAGAGVGRYYGAFGSIFLLFLDVACARAGVEAGPLGLIVRPDLVDDTPMMCGSAEDLIQIQRHP